MRRMKGSGWLLMIGCSAAAAEPVLLDPVTVTAPRATTELYHSAAALSVIDPVLAQEGTSALTLDEALRGVPGLVVANQYNQAQGLRLSIRGFGARAAFGVRGIRVLLDGIPLTLPDGQTQLDGVDTTLLDRVEVVRGPFSAAYGNASGGVVHLYTQEAGPDPLLVLRGQAGSYGLGDVAVRGGLETGNWNLFGGVRATREDGYRDHSESERLNAHGKFRYGINGTASLTTVVNASYREAEDPGALTRAQWREDARAAGPNNPAMDAGERADQQRIGWIFHDGMENGDELEARAFIGHRDYRNRLPFENGGQVAFTRWVTGLGATYTYARTLFGRENRLALGVDAEHQRDDRQRYDNVQGDRGARTLDQLETVGALGVFVENEWRPTERLTLSVGGRYDNIRLEVDDRFDDGTEDASGDRSLDEVSGLLGGTFALWPRHRAYANIATVFETPTTNELANPAGRGFNPDLEAQTAVNHEVGLRGEIGSSMDYELAVYSIRLRDELVPYGLPDEPGRTYYRNAGRSERDGVEARVEWWPSDPWRVTAAYAYSDYHFRRFDEYVGSDGTTDEFVSRAGNTIPGIPRHRLVTELGYHGTRGFGAMNIRYHGRTYADNANEEEVGGYTVVDIRAGVTLPWGGDWRVFGGVNNVFDRNYTANLRINDGGGRYYEPAPERNFYAGVEAYF